MKFKTLRVSTVPMLFICAFAASAQPPSTDKELFSPTAALAFYETAHDLIFREFPLLSVRPGKRSVWKSFDDLKRTLLISLFPVTDAMTDGGSFVTRALRLT